MKRYLPHIASFVLSAGSLGGCFNERAKIENQRMELQMKYELELRHERNRAERAENGMEYYFDAYTNSVRKEQ